MTAPPIPIHPEAVPGEPQRLRWVIPAATLDVVGPVPGLPPALAALVEDGTVASVVAEPTAVLVELCADRSWRAEGTRVRTALQATLTSPASWRAEAAQSSDEILRFAADQVLAGEVGDYIRSHGGAVRVLGVDDGVVQVSLSGACSHCPASDLTLTERIEKAIRAQCPWLRGITADAEPGRALRHRLLALTPLRH